MFAAATVLLAGATLPPALWAAGGAGQPPGASEQAEARRLIEAGEAVAAVESAFGALRLSERFAPEDWSDLAPEAGIVLDEFTGAATAAYRRQRAGYRLTLGDALAAAGDAEGAATEYERASALDPRPETWRRLADLPHLPPRRRVRFLLRSWAASQRDRPAVLDLLRATGAFRTEDGLAAALDRFRFRAPGAFRRGAPEGLAPETAPFLPLTLAVEGGAWSSARSFSEGRSLLLYYPAAGCPLCGEVVADLQVALRNRAVDLIAAARDPDLPILIRIAQLTGAGLFQPEPQTAADRSGLAPRPVGHVVRRDTVAFRPGAEDDEALWLAARSGLSVWRLPLDRNDSVRRAVGAVFRFLDDSPVAGGQDPLVEIPADPEGMMAALALLEAGGEPLADLEDRLLDAVRTRLRGAADAEALATRLLRAASALTVGDAARRRLLTGLVPEFGERLLEAARLLDDGVVRALPGGRLRVAVGPAAAAENVIAVQREYEGRDEERLVLAAVVRPGGGGEVRGLDLSAGRATAVLARNGGFVFLRRPEGEDESCAAWGPPEGPLTEHCPATMSRGEVVARRRQLVDGPDDRTDDRPDRGPDDGETPDAPHYFVRQDGGPSPPEVEALTEGLAAFAAGDLAAAEAAFHRSAAAAGPGSPIDRAAVRYNLARITEARGDRGAALSALLAIGDATFQPVVDRALRRLYQARD